MHAHSTRSATLQQRTQRMQPDVGVALRVVTNGHFLLRIQIGYGFGEGVNFSLAGTGL